jgi:hypothetical protein
MRSSDKLWAMFIVTVIAVSSVGQSYATVINATDARGIRSLEGGDPFLLDFLSILLPGPPIEDRTVLEFDVSALAPVPPTTQLILPIQNQDQPGGPPGESIDVFTFIGNGVVQASEFFAGNFFATIPTGNVAHETLLLDVTAAVQETIANSGQFLGFRLSTTSGRYIPQPDPVLSTAVPEPSTIAIITIGLLVLALINRRGPLLGRIRQPKSSGRRFRPT